MPGVTFLVPKGDGPRAAPPAILPQTVELTVLMPCLNEARTLGACIERALRFVEEAGVSAEIVIADNGSTDGSQALARELGARVIDVPERGYGAALFRGASASLGTYIIMGDSDGSYDFSRLAPFVERLREGYQLVMGNRFAGIRPGAMPWKNRYLGNPVLSGLGRLFFACPVRDLHCGLRGFSREAFETMNLQTTGMEFASEMVIKATLLGLRITEVPTTLDKDGRDRPPHLRPWRDGWRHLRFMLLYSPGWLFLYPGLLLMVLGTVLGAMLERGPVRVGAIGLDVHTLLFCALAVLLGAQAVSFWLFARVFAVSEGLIPQDLVLQRLFRWISLEVGLIVGGVLCLAGFGGALATLLVWGGRGFGGLQPTETLRLAIPGATGFVLGCQVILSSFFLSVLGLRRRR